MPSKSPVTMNLDAILQLITPEVHANLRTAVETGKWPDGNVLTPEQRESCMQAIIVYEARTLQPDERIGYIDLGHKAAKLAGDEPEVVRIVRSNLG